MSDSVSELMKDNIGDDFVLSSVYEIENALLLLDQMSQKMAFYSELKKFRAKAIDEKVTAIQDRCDRVRQVILRTMKALEPNQKTMHFPSVGKVSRRKGLESIETQDPDALMDFLQKNSLKDDVVETKEVVNARKLKEVVRELIKQNVKVPGVKVSTGEESLNISFELNKADTPVDKLEKIDKMESLGLDDL